MNSAQQVMKFNIGVIVTKRLGAFKEIRIQRLPNKIMRRGRPRSRPAFGSLRTGGCKPPLLHTLFFDMALGSVQE